MRNIVALTLTVVSFFSIETLAQDAKEIVRKSDEKLNGEKSSYSEMSMTIVRPKYQRRIAFKSWAEGNQKALTYITYPANDKGKTFLKSGNNLWSWTPDIQRIIKLPPSMMSQGWMGSDFTNDDILKESSFLKDYTQKLLKTDVVDNQSCWCIELLPLSRANVVWGKIILWITQQDYLQIKAEYYDEDKYLVKTHKGSKLAVFDGRKLPSILEIIPSDDKDSKTVVKIEKMQFNKTFDANLFTQQNMKRVQ